jgi:hypothetical protein
MAFVKVHGMELAQGGYVQNMVVESLASDPAVDTIGRVWYNETSDRWKMSIDNGLGAVVVKTFANLEELTTYQNLLASTVANEGSHSIGYDGSGAQSYGLFSLSAGGVDSALDAIAARIDIEMKQLDNTQSGYLDLAGNNIMTGDLDMGNKKITNMADGVDPNDAVTRQQLDAVMTGLDVKDSCRLATTANLDAIYSVANMTLTENSNGKLTLDTIDAVVGNRILVKNQDNAEENGIYDVTVAGDANTPWVLTRSEDANNVPGSEVTSGMFAFIEEGTINANFGYILVTDGAIVLGTTELSFTRFTGADAFNAGWGLARNGNTVDVEVADFIDTTKGLATDGAGGGYASKISVNIDTVQYDGLAGTNSKFSISATNAGTALDTLVQKIDQEIADLLSTNSDKGTSLLGYSGQAGANSLFSVSAGLLDASLDSVVTAIDADLKALVDYKALLLANATGSGAVGYVGQNGVNSLFNLGSTKVDVALNSLALGLDAEMKSTDDFIADLASQTATKGSALTGYDGSAGANSLFSLAASQVDAALDSLVTGLDAEMKSTDNFIADLLSQTATKGSALTGYDGSAGVNSLFSLAASQVDAALDSLVTGLDAEMKSTDLYIASLASTSVGSGATLVGYAGVSGNSNFNLSATNLDNALDLIISQIDTVMGSTSNSVVNLVNSINAKTASGESVAALSHTITHNLNTQKILTQIWVKDDSDNWVNDLVSVTVTSVNAITVDLTESRAVKWSVMSMEDVVSA